MPIYAYRCAECGHAKDVLQKMSDPVLTTCPVCHAEAFKKQVTAAGFQLKGSGWYATDFKGGGTAPPAAESEGGAPAPAAGAAPAAAATSATPALASASSAASTASPASSPAAPPKPSSSSAA